MPLQYVYLFLAVVLEEGKTVSEYAADAGVPQTVMTRHLLEIGSRTRSHAEGLGLIEQHTDLQDLRKHRASVTNVGKATMHKVKQALYSARKSKGREFPKG
jgi:DNA-binding MarR family transcriptional regulator